MTILAGLVRRLVGIVASKSILLVWWLAVSRQAEVRLAMNQRGPSLDLNGDRRERAISIRVRVLERTMWKRRL